METKAVTVMMDTSGLKIFGAGEWLQEKHGGSCTSPSIRPAVRWRSST
jgi:hypothetical protein